MSTGNSDYVLTFADAPEQKTKTVGAGVGPELFEQVSEEADRRGVSKSSLLRALLRAEFGGDDTVVRARVTDEQRREVVARAEEQGVTSDRVAGDLLADALDDDGVGLDGLDAEVVDALRERAAERHTDAGALAAQYVEDGLAREERWTRQRWVVGGARVLMLAWLAAIVSLSTAYAVGNVGALVTAVTGVALLVVGTLLLGPLAEALTGEA